MGIQLVVTPAGKRFKIAYCTDCKSPKTETALRLPPDFQGVKVYVYRTDIVTIPEDGYWQAFWDPRLEHKPRNGTPEPDGEVLPIPDTIARATRKDHALAEEWENRPGRNARALLPIVGESVVMGTRALGVPRIWQTDRGDDKNMNLDKPPILPTSITHLLRPAYAKASVMKQEGPGGPGTQQSQTGSEPQRHAYSGPWTNDLLRKGYNMLLATRWARRHNTHIRPTPDGQDMMIAPRMAKRPRWVKGITPQEPVPTREGHSKKSHPWDHPFDTCPQSHGLKSCLRSRQITFPFDTQDLDPEDPRLDPQETRIEVRDCGKTKVETPLTPHELVVLGIKEVWQVVVKITIQQGYLWEGGSTASRTRGASLERYVKTQWVETDPPGPKDVTRDTLSGFMRRRDNGSYEWLPGHKLVRGAPRRRTWLDLPRYVTEGIFPTKPCHGAWWGHKLVTGYTGQPAPGEVRLAAVNPPKMIYCHPPWFSQQAVETAEDYHKARYKYPLARRIARVATWNPPNRHPASRLIGNT